MIQTKTGSLSAARNLLIPKKGVAAVGDAVVADPTQGSDSALYRAFGYTRQSDRKTGLTHKGNKTPPR